MKDYNTTDYYKYFFDTQVKNGYTTKDYQGLINLHQQGAQWLHNQGVRTAFEIGSGLGFFLQGAKNVGIQAKGYDINPYERDFAIENGIDPDAYILGVPDQFGIDGEYDAFYSVEVFEHIVDETLIPLVEQIAEKGKWFFFTSTPNYTTPEADEDWGHINIKPVEKWIEFFEQHGLKFHSLNKTVCEWGTVMTGKRWEV
jgi:hypothetical protein